MRELFDFVDIMEPRRTQSGIFSYMSRNWQPKTTLELEKQYSPQELKDFVAKSVYLDTIIEAESIRTGVNKDKLHKEVAEYLKEMGLDKKIHIIRWMGVLFLKICFMMKIKIFVNEPEIHKLKTSMGRNPVLFLPTHRSYADFCLMTYLCYHYDIDFPAVAAGMDFYSMAVVGRRMRETCAFYIRRTLVGAPLYAATLRQYVRTLVAKHCAPIEFFLEGTRSRSNKSLPPKYGMLSMSLVPLFAREVSDVTLVPLNISYDRLMEHGLFAYEHLGVPKPKESTGGFLKALRSLNDHFGNIYINLGSPISVREYLQQSSHSKEILNPVDLQQLTPEQFSQVQDIAEYVISRQQECTVATISNLMALVLMQSLVRAAPLSERELVAEVEWMVGVLRSLGASVFENDIPGSVARILVVHRQMMRLDSDKRLRLVSGAVVDVSEEMKKKMKGHTLSAETMSLAVPVIQLQLYVNPILHYLVPPAIVYLIATRGPASEETIAADYHRLRKLLRHEFFHLEHTENDTFQKAQAFCVRAGALPSGAVPAAGRLRLLLRWAAWPALATLLNCAETMRERGRCEERRAAAKAQARAEARRQHPYCLSLEAAANCLHGLARAGALRRDRTDMSYEVVPKAMEECIQLIGSVMPQFEVDFGRSNPVIVDQKAAARL